ncbi:hypothetical protein Patl1_09864 [Pistacia atlantica]|uniref:Uncharacterized protein n=1 Tax=Pistacia atlantica TaxID=434234 RepID=A0ACC1A8D3_9ROSI|nr:hypothetical protein Patl1_09864 [Pistacia atlantica]
MMQEGESSSHVPTPTLGNTTIIIYPKDFDITWGNDEKYWTRPTNEKPEGPAELKRVCWLQVTGSKKVERGKSYEIKFNISSTKNFSGWNGLPLFLMAKIGAKGKSIWKKIKPLEQTPHDKKYDIPKPEEEFIVKIPDGKGDEELFFGLYEIWSNKWKGGLLVNHATLKEVSKLN